MLIELPSGEFISPKAVMGVRPMVHDKMGPRVLLDVTTATQVIMIEFDNRETALSWARDFASKVNASHQVS